LKIGLVIYGSLDTVSGGYLYDRMLVSKLRRRGDTVEIISVRRRHYAISLLDNLRRLDTSHFDVVIQDELNHPSLFLANLRARKAPFISIVHHLRCSERRAPWENAIYRFIERAYLESVDGFILNSETTRSTVEHLLRQAKPHVVATPGGDRLGESSIAHVRDRARQPGPLRLLCLGSVTPAKGVDVLLDALAILPRNEFTLEMVGSTAVAPGFAARMRRKAAALKLPVDFSGEMGDNEVEVRLRRSHVMVLPSFYEGFGIALLEGMAHGLPAVAARAGAVASLIRDGENGYLVSPGNSAALAERLRQIGQSRELLTRLGLEALAQHAGYATWDQSTERIRDFLLTVVRG
jgi:glycosyltransferase involved in cell wall biosynthesis